MAAIPDDIYSFQGNDLEIHGNEKVVFKIQGKPDIEVIFNEIKGDGSFIAVGGEYDGHLMKISWTDRYNSFTITDNGNGTYMYEFYINGIPSFIVDFNQQITNVLNGLLLPILQQHNGAIIQGANLDPVNNPNPVNNPGVAEIGGRRRRLRNKRKTKKRRVSKKKKTHRRR
jgi:hypothetical protein